MRASRWSALVHPSLREPGWWIAQLALLGIAGYHLWEFAGCLNNCYADIAKIREVPGSVLSLSDMRLNSWILAWVQRACFEAPASLFDGNIFHPADGVLTGSEHMFGVSLLLLPLRFFEPGAVLLHQVATILSFVIMGWTTFALCRWLTRSTWAAWLGAATAMFMPWRISELVHIQLLSAQWFPLVWLLIGKIMTGEARRHSAVLLWLVLLVQLLSSYYLAYFLTASIAVLVAVLALRHGMGRKTRFSLGAALAGAYAPFVLVSLPYLQRETSSDLVPRIESFFNTDLSEALAHFTQGLSFQPDGLPALNYAIPLCVFLFALLGVPLGRLREVRGDRLGRRVGSFAIALWLVALTGVVFALGHRTWVGGMLVELPGSLAADWIPGFKHLRGFQRWAFLAGIASPVLASIGVWRAERALSRLAPQRRTAALLGARAAVLAFVVLNMPWGTIPVRSVELAGAARPYEVLRDLPPGPVLEIPWLPLSLKGVDIESRYTLASTLHWKPILNGFTGYPPRLHAFLRGLGSRLPAQDALEKLVRLTGLRWIVVHVQELTATERSEWEDRLRRGVLRRVYRDRQAWILEVVDRSRGGVWTEAVRSPARRSRTLTGLSREPLSIPEGSSRLEVEIPHVLRKRFGRLTSNAVVVSIANGSQRSWAGLDNQTEGLVQLRYDFVADDGTLVQERILPLYADVPAGKTLVESFSLELPEQRGDYRLRFALVQCLAGDLVELPVPQVEGLVSVSARGRR